MREKLSQFELTRVIGARAQQISMGAPSTVDITGMSNPMLIAEKELRERKIPIIIQRCYPTGVVKEFCVSEMDYEI